MKKKILLVFTGLVIILTLAFTPVGAKPATVLPGGVGAGPLFHWRYQSGTTASNTAWWLDEAFMDDIKVATGGRVYVDLLPVNSICTSFETLDATMTGAIEMASS